VTSGENSNNKNQQRQGQFSGGRRNRSRLSGVVCYIGGMSTDPTEPQGGQELRRSREMSLKRGHPPTQVPGYEPEKFLGLGAYGEVWVAREQNTGRRVAIKFYAHRSGLDWSLLSREVEKLAFLFADRYVVQLLGVGWDAEPPYYIMEYLDRGSLAERLQQGPLPVDQAVRMFRDVAVGLVHAHGKGVLHCDLKPANILLDQDDKPRLADFGQSRMSTEQVPALGTLFYMAPEQADLEAAPDARWDVYALGALLYCMLAGSPPHRTGKAVRQFESTPHLVQRLDRYRQMIEQSPLPTGHRQVRGVDRALAEIVDRCLAPDPEKRFPNVQAVLDALDVRAARRAKRPMMVLGAALPALLLLVVTWFAWRGFSTAVQQSDAALTHRALESNRFAAQYVARTAASELDRRFSAVRHMAASRRFQQMLRETVKKEKLARLLQSLSESAPDAPQRNPLRRDLHENPDRQALQREFEALIPPDMSAPQDVASWFLCDARGVSMIRLPEPEDPKSITVGNNYVWRSYFHGGSAEEAPTWKPDLADVERAWRPQQPGAPKPTRLSAIFPSQATGRWAVAISTGVFDDSPVDGEFLGVVALTVEVGQFAELQSGGDQFAVLVNWRDGNYKGVILQHPLFDQLIAEHGKLDDSFKEYSISEEDLPGSVTGPMTDYRDPLADVDSHGSRYDRQWLAYVERVEIPGEDGGWLVIVQEAYDTAMGATLSRLKTGLLHRGLAALLLVVLIMGSLWWFATRLSVKY